MKVNVKKMAQIALIIYLLLASAFFSLSRLDRPVAAGRAPLGVTPTITPTPPDPPALETPTPVFTPITPVPAPTSTPMPTSTPGAPPTSPADPPGEPTPSQQVKIRINKSANPAVVSPGGQVVFTIQVCNAGEATAENVVVSDALPPELVLVSASASQGVVVIEGNGMRAELGALAAGACAQVTVTARVRPDVAPGTQIRNVASVGPLYDDVDVTVVGLLPESGAPNARPAWAVLTGLLALGASGVFVALALRKQSARRA